MTLAHCVWTTLFAAASALPATAQDAWWTPADITAMEAETQARVRATQGDLGVTLPPPLGDDPRLDDIVDADRVFSPSREAQEFSFSGGAVLVEDKIDASITGTGFPENYQYQIPSEYDENDPDGHPLVIAYHGYGGSHKSTAFQSTIHVECDARGWIYLAPIGLDSHFFGPPASMTHVRLAIDWIITNYNVDLERIYMVGFSMGAGVSANFAARQRDADGVMIAALGLVSGTYDWTQEHYLTSAQSVYDNMEHPLCFNGPPSQFPFSYQRASALYFDPPTYSAHSLPGTRVDDLSMAINLPTIPTYVTWDADDTLPQVVPGNTALVDLLVAQETEHVVEIVTGTPTTHSWSVLDEVALFDFFETRTANRMPRDITVLSDEPTSVSFLDLESRNMTSFTRVDASSDGVAGEVAIERAENVDTATIDIQAAGISGVWPVRVAATSNDAKGYTLRTTNYDALPSYKLDHATEELITGVQSDPLTDSLEVEIAPSTSLDTDVISEPWTGRLYTDPNPVPLGADMQVEFDAAPGTESVWLNVGFSELLVSLSGGFKITSSPLAPSLLLPLPVDAQGDLSLEAMIPNDAEFIGLELFLQFVSILPTSELGEVSNMWVMRVQ